MTTNDHTATINPVATPIVWVLTAVHPDSEDQMWVFGDKHRAVGFMRAEADLLEHDNGVRLFEDWGTDGSVCWASDERAPSEEQTSSTWTLTPHEVL